MYSVTVCVVLVIVGNVSSFSLSRTRRGLEETIFELYGPPNGPREMQHPPPHLTEPDRPVKRSHVEKPKVQIPQEVLDAIWGPPHGPTEPRAEPSAPHLFSAFIDKTQWTEDKDHADMSVLPTTASEPMNYEENSNTSNGTDDRFLSETLIRQQWIKNREKDDKDTSAPPEGKSSPGKGIRPLEPETSESKHTSIPLEPESSQSKHTTIPLEPEPTEIKHTSIPLEPLPLDTRPISRGLVPLDETLETRHVNPTQHVLPPKPTNNSSKHIVSSSLLIVVVYLCLENFVLM